MIIKELISLHEELLNFLLNYRSESKYLEKPNFMFRSAEDIEALSSGRWFYDKPESGWVNIYFTSSGEHRVYKNNVQFGININGDWNISIFLNQSSQLDSRASFWERLIQSFSNFVKKHSPLMSQRKNDTNIILSPIDKNYRTGLPEALNTLFQFFIKENIDIQHSDNSTTNLSLISKNTFQESLLYIKDYRNQLKVTNVHIDRFKIKNYQGIKDVELVDVPHSSWIFLTGENGFGKTCLLKALAIGLFGDEQDIITPRNKISEIEVCFTNTYNNHRQTNTINHIRHPLFFRPLHNFATYGPSRLEIQSNDNLNQQVKNSTATFSLFHTDCVLKNIESELLISYYDAPTKFDILCNILMMLIPSLDKIELDKSRRKILYYEKPPNKNSTTEIFEPIEFDQLASGIRSIVAMAGDIYLRLTEMQNKNDINFLKHTDLPKKLPDQSIYKPEELYGIVIIDELDLHLHPKWQRELPSLLTQVFPNIQFIASTHSPIPLLGAPKDSVILKVNRTVEKGVEVKRLTELEKQICNLLPNSILTSPIFDLENFFPVSHNQDESIEKFYLIQRIKSG
ncbi:MAG: SMC domain-containing protein [Candidatus Magnetoglobus multicellularis str. Araruama]|uniref:SMC domain-containing protein n=1 Tax=Candidatus Magnetoglobus multicellularis str. Araruama TaxID=890399 RepID=A0A1V1P0P8_9BACT|nr:MAG: SMC domain-containing protein [Candidatus Magnetoglobus multicellularis str. Araruama]